MMSNSKKKRKFLSIVLSAVLFVGLGFYDVSATTNDGTGELVDVIVTFDHIPNKIEQDTFRGLGGNVTHSFTIIPAVAGSLPLNGIEALKRNPHVVSVELDHPVYAVETDYAAELSRTWSVGQIRADEAHDAYYFGDSIKVAVLDSGVDYQHSDLAGSFNAEELGMDFVEAVNDVDGPMDVYGHGTHVAGSIAAVRNGLGVVGVAPNVQIVALRILDDDGVGAESRVIAALEWIKAYNANPLNTPIRITNNSYGTGAYSSALEAAFNATALAGVLHIAAAGNSGNLPGRGDNVIYPAKYASVVAVAAVDKNNLRASWSSTGADVEISAPGVSVLSTWNDNISYLDPQPYLLDGDYYKEGSGTSMASPHVAGVAALLMAANPVYTAEQVRQRMNETAFDLGISGRDTLYGYGLVDAYMALGLSITTNNQPIANDLMVTTDEDIPINLILTGSDVDGDILIYEIVNGPSHGSLTTDTLPNTTYTPNKDYNGTDSFTFKVNDGIIDSNVATVYITIAPVDDPPILNTVNVSIEITPTTKPAGKNEFTLVTAKVSVGEPNELIPGALVTGYWEGATSDMDSGTTGIDGTVSMTSDAVKNWDGSLPFTFIVNNVTIDGVTYEPIGETSDSFFK
jgi:hypothetical protein